MSYSDRSYTMSVTQHPDSLSIQKSKNQDWVTLAMITNGSDNGCITIRSKEMAESLHFMLGQLLGKKESNQ